MIKSVIRFYSQPPAGKGLFDINAEPKKCYSFLIVSSPWQVDNSGIASVLPLTTESGLIPGLRSHYLSESGGEESAYSVALESLRSIDTLSSLGMFEQRD